MRSRVAASSSAGGGQASCPAVTLTRQVEQRARPPHIAACAQMEAPARLQHRPPPGHPDGLPGIRQRDEALFPPLHQIADLAGDEGAADDREIPVQQIVLPLRDGEPLHGVFRTEELQGFGRRGRAVGELLAHGDKSESRQHRQQQGRREQHEAELPIPAAPAEGEMQPETAMQPARRHQAELPALRAGGPQVGDDPGVVRRQPEHFISEARRRGMPDQQDRHGEAEHDAEQFKRRQAEGAPLVDREQRHHEMHGEGAVQHEGAGRAVPDLDRNRHPGFRGVERNQPERVVDEMGADIGEQDQAGRHPELAPQRTRQPLQQHVPLLRVGARRDAASAPPELPSWPIMDRQSAANYSATNIAI